MNRVIAGAASLAVAAAVAGTAGACSWGPATTHYEDRSYDMTAQGVTALTLRVDAAGATVVGTDNEKITWHEHLVYTKYRKPTPFHTAKGGDLALGYRCPGGITIGYNRCDVSYTVEVPRRLAANLTSDTGSLQIRGLAGRVTARVDSGRLDAYGLASGGDLTADSGTVAVEGAGGDLRVRADSGTIRLSGLRTRTLDAAADSGSVRAGFLVPPAKVTVHADSGMINLDVPGGPAYAIDARSDNGSIHTDGILKSDTSPYKISARADSGSIRISPS